MIALGCRVLIRKSLVKPAPEVLISWGAGTGAEADALAEQVQRALEAARLSGPVQLMSGPSAAGQG